MRPVSPVVTPIRCRDGSRVLPHELAKLLCDPELHTHQVVNLKQLIAELCVKSRSLLRGQYHSVTGALNMEHDHRT